MLRSFEVARLIGVWRPTLSKFEAGRGRVNQDVLAFLEEWEANPELIPRRRPKVTIRNFPDFREPRRR